MNQPILLWKIATSAAFALGAGLWATYLFEPVNPVTKSLLFLIPAALFAIGLFYDVARKDLKQSCRRWWRSGSPARPSSSSSWPKNSHGYSPTLVSLTNAFEESRNAAAVNLLRKIGVDPVKATAARRGVTGDFPANIGLALALGIRETRPLEMAVAYAVFTNGDFR